jgi:hypothetical protein
MRHTLANVIVIYITTKFWTFLYPCIFLNLPAVIQEKTKNLLIDFLVTYNVIQVIFDGGGGESLRIV